MGYRRKARECAMQMLFRADMTGEAAADVLASFWSDRVPPAPVREYADRIVEGVIDDLEAIDALLVSSSHNWRLDRMSAVDRCLLRMAIYEFRQQPDTPGKVVINETIEIAKKYSSEESGHFVNGILDAIRRELDAIAS